MTARPTGTYTDLHFPPTPTGYLGYSWTVDVLVDPSPDGVFWAHQFWIRDSGVGGYVGLQTVGSGIGGRTAIFSIWDALECDRGSDRHGAPIAKRFGGEGTGMQCLISYPWEREHAHALRLVLSQRAQWHATVDGLPIGTIRVPEPWGNLDENSVCWTERYAGPDRRLSDLRASVVRFGEVRANDTIPVAWRHHHLADPPGDCPSHIADPDADHFEHHMCAP